MTTRMEIVALCDSYIREESSFRTIITGVINSGFITLSDFADKMEVGPATAESWVQGARTPMPSIRAYAVQTAYNAALNACSNKSCRLVDFKVNHDLCIDCRSIQVMLEIKRRLEQLPKDNRQQVLDCVTRQFPMTMSRQDVSSLHALAGVVVAAAPARLRQALDAFRAGYSSASPTVTAAIDALQWLSTQANGNLQLVITGLSATQPVLAAAIERAQEARHEHRARRVSHGCTCSYGESEEMTRHAPLCAVQQPTFTSEPKVFNLRQELSVLNGQTFDGYLLLKEELRAILQKNLGSLPPGTGPDKLYDLALKAGYISSRGGSITIDTSFPPVELHWQLLLGYNDRVFLINKETSEDVGWLSIDAVLDIVEATSPRDD